MPVAAATSRRRRQHGAALVELALVTLPMRALTLAAIDLGRAMYAYDVLVRATRGATRRARRAPR